MKVYSFLLTWQCLVKRVVLCQMHLASEFEAKYGVIFLSFYSSRILYRRTITYLEKKWFPSLRILCDMQPVERIKQLVAYPQYIKQIDFQTQKKRKWNAIEPGYLTPCIINWDHRILWKSMVHAVIFYENYLVFLFQKCIYFKTLFETCIHVSIIFISYIFLVYLSSNKCLILFQVLETPWPAAMPEKRRSQKMHCPPL